MLNAETGGGLRARLTVLDEESNYFNFCEILLKFPANLVETKTFLSSIPFPLGKNAFT